MQNKKPGWQTQSGLMQRIIRGATVIDQSANSIR